MTVNIEDIEKAARTIAGDVVHTPTTVAPGLSHMAGCKLHLKLENLQLTGSFKARGARNWLADFAGTDGPGVIACSAGNHAQAVACFAGRLGIPATIVMPRATPFAKVEKTERFGARVILEGETFAGALTHSHALAESENLAFISPYDDDRIITGQGTAGLEMIEDAPDLDVVVIPVGGGGLIAGCATAIKARRPVVEIIGV
jgi:threonine dehydratase